MDKSRSTHSLMKLDDLCKNLEDITASDDLENTKV